MKTKHVLRAGAFQLWLLTHGALQRVLHCIWQHFLWSGSENCSEAKPGLGFCFPPLPSPPQQGQALPASQALKQLHQQDRSLPFLHGSHCPFPLPQHTAPLKVKRFPSATLFAWQRILILQLTELSSSGAGT